MDEFYKKKRKPFQLISEPITYSKVRTVQTESIENERKKSDTTTKPKPMWFECKNGHFNNDLEAFQVRLNKWLTK